MKTFPQQGFTLLELLFAVTIAGIVLGLAIPSMSQFVKNERLTSFRNTLFTDLNLARSTSVGRNQPVIVCASSNGTSCTAGSFEGGWVVGIDDDNDGTITAADELLKVQQSIGNGIGFFSTVGNTIAFDSRGFSPNTNGSISVCDDRGNSSGIVITISVTGRVGRGENPTCS